MIAPEVVACGYLSVDDLHVGGARHERIPGGVVYCALGAARAGARTAILASAGSDYPAEWLAWLADEGIDVSAVGRSRHPSRRAGIMQRDDGSRRSLSYSRAAWSEATLALEPPPMPDAWAPAAVALGPMPASAAGRVAACAKEKGAVVVMDTSEYYAGREPEQVLSVLEFADLAAPSREETRLLLAGLSDDDAICALFRRNGRMAIQKRGADGLVLLSLRYPDGLHEPASPGLLLDATGAGDSCIGALAAGMGRRLPEPELLRLASRIASRTIAHVGPWGLSETHAA